MKAVDQLQVNQHMAKHTGMMASEVSFAEMQIKTKSFMFFITRLTENTNLAVIMPASEGAFNCARMNVQIARQEFAHLDIVEKKGKEVQRAPDSMSAREDDVLRGNDDDDR